MTNISHLKFLFDIGEKKPNSMRDKNTSCPFCHSENLTGILDKDGEIILVKNKYPTLEDTFQTVLVETADCCSNMSTYDKDHMRRLMKFGLNHWIDMENSGEFKSVLFYKNHGPCSGGTINHSHMQIVGLKNVDYRTHLKDEFFEGIKIAGDDHCFLNLSTKPHIGFNEFNIVMDSMSQADSMADLVQTIVHYFLNNYSANCNSFNLFFYQWNGKIICKAVPRFVTSPLFVGFSIPQVSNRLTNMAEHMRQLYFNED